AALAARALVPARFKGTKSAFASVAAAGLIAALPWAYAAARPTFKQPEAPLAAWLQAHGLHYGLGSYGDGSTITVLTHGKVKLRVAHVGATSFGRSHYEVREDWYFPSRYDATFVVADPSARLSEALIVHRWGKPFKTYQVDGRAVLVYHKNLLQQLTPS
ncbi:MAG: hypothetical protein ACRDNW_19970, partial [Trebonia sp.]